MVRPLVLYVLILLAALPGLAAADPPRLVVVLVVDQMRNDYMPRISGTFGEDAPLTAHLAKAYIEGFQGKTRTAERGLHDQTLSGRRAAE